MKNRRLNACILMFLLFAATGSAYAQTIRQVEVKKEQPAAQGAKPSSAQGIKLVKPTGSDRRTARNEPHYTVDGRPVDKETLRYIPIDDVKDICIMKMPASFQACGMDGIYGAVFITLRPGCKIDESRIARGRLDNELGRLFPVGKEARSCKKPSGKEGKACK